MARRMRRSHPDSLRAMGRYIVTGGAGFIGSHVASALLDRGDDVIVVDDLSTGTRANAPADASLIVADIADADALAEATATIERADGIIHCAAQASVIASIDDPERDRAVNADGTRHVLALCRRLRAPLVLTSTAAVYGTTAPLPTREDSPIAPDSPYGASKAEAELAVRDAAAADGLPHAICRLANVYGPRQRGDGEAGVVAVIAERLDRGASITLYGHGEPTRDFVHVADVARALLAALGTGATCNVATGIATPVRVVYDLATSVVPDRCGAPVLADLREGEIMHSRLDPALAAEMLGWTAAIPVAEGVPATIAQLTTT